MAETVLAALQQLPLSLRVPVVLRYYADLSERTSRWPSAGARAR